MRTVLWRADMQALVFHQNANNIICNIQGNIIVVLIGEKKNVDGCTCPPHHPAILITAAEIKRGRGGGLAGGMDLLRCWCLGESGGSGRAGGRTGAGPPERERFSPVGLLCRMIYSWRHMAALGALFGAVRKAPICVATPRGPQPRQSPR